MLRVKLTKKLLAINSIISALELIDEMVPGPEQVPPTPETETSSSSFKWDNSNTRMPIQSYSEHKHLFKKGRMTKKQIFDKVATYYNSHSAGGEAVSGEQCQRKWNKLIQKKNRTCKKGLEISRCHGRMHGR